MAAAPRRSRRRSAASSRSTPPEARIYFVDRSLGRRVVPDALRRAGVQVRIHDDHFAQDAHDADWLADVGRRGWVVLTKDDRIRYRPLERGALLAGGVRAFVMTAKGLTGPEMGRVLVEALPAMERLIERLRGSFIARVSRSGSVSLLDAPQGGAGVF
jgi:hypothetical protein